MVTTTRATPGIGVLCFVYLGQGPLFNRGDIVVLHGMFLYVYVYLSLGISVMRCVSIDYPSSMWAVSFSLDVCTPSARRADTVFVMVLIIVFGFVFIEYSSDLIDGDVL